MAEISLELETPHTLVPISHPNPNMESYCFSTLCTSAADRPCRKYKENHCFSNGQAGNTTTTNVFSTMRKDQCDSLNINYCFCAGHAGNIQKTDGFRSTKLPSKWDCSSGSLFTYEIGLSPGVRLSAQRLETHKKPKSNNGRAKFTSYAVPDSPPQHHGYLT